jgi:ABC-type multidrug transport system fused ATPase/permease subunit
MPFSAAAMLFSPSTGTVFIIGAAANGMRNYLFTMAGERLIASLRRRLFGSIISQELAFFDRTRTGELINRLSTDTVVMGRSLTGETLSTGLRSSFQLLGAFGVMTYLSPQLTAAMLGILPVAAAGSMYYGKTVRTLSRELQTSLSKATEVADERLGDIRTVRAFGHEDQEKFRYNAEVDNVFGVASRLAKAQALFYGSAGLIGNTTLLAVLSYGASVVFLVFFLFYYFFLIYLILVLIIFFKSNGYSFAFFSFILFFTIF